jgi:hypothetical protein
LQAAPAAGEHGNRQIILVPDLLAISAFSFPAKAKNETPKGVRRQGSFSGSERDESFLGRGN